MSENSEKSAASESLSRILAKTVDVVVHGETFQLHRPSGETISGIMQLEDTSKDAKEAGSKLIPMVISACLPGLSETEALALFAAADGIHGELWHTASGLCGMNRDAVEKAFETGEENSDGAAQDFSRAGNSATQ